MGSEMRAGTPWIISSTLAAPRSYISRSRKLARGGRRRFRSGYLFAILTAVAVVSSSIVGSECVLRLFHRLHAGGGRRVDSDLVEFVEEHTLGTTQIDDFGMVAGRAASSVAAVQKKSPKERYAGSGGRRGGTLLGGGRNARAGTPGVSSTTTQGAKLAQRARVLEEMEKRFLMQPFQLYLQIRGGCDPQGLAQCLASLKTGDYGGDLVHLTVVVNCSAAMHAYKAFKWTHGGTRVLMESAQFSIDPFQHWKPLSSHEFLFLLDSSSQTSASFYSFLKSLRVSPSTFLTEGAQDGQKKSSTASSLLGVALDPLARPLLEDSLSGADFREAVAQHNRQLPPPAQGTFLSSRLTATCQMVFPEWWLEFRNWHRKNQVQQLGNTTLRHELHVYDFSAPCRTDWKASLATYVAERPLYNLFHGRDQALNVPCVSISEVAGLESSLLSNNLEKGHTPSGRNQSQPDTSVQHPDKDRDLLLLPKFDHCGELILPGKIASSVKELREMLEPLAMGGAVAGVMVSPGYDAMLANWLCYIKELSLANYFIITQDSRQAEELAKQGLAVYLTTQPHNASWQSGDQVASLGEQPLDYGSVEYKLFILARTQAVGEILHQGYDILLADVDAVWFSDPFVHMQEEGVDVFAQLEARGEPCGGFLYLRHTPAVIKMWDLISAMFTEHVMWIKMHPSKQKGPEEYKKFLRSQQHNNEQRYLRNLLASGRSHVMLQGLDPLQFINGRDYFDHKKAQRAGVKPVMIHNNYVIGMEKKTNRFIRTGLWRLDLPGRFCKCLSLVCKKSSPTVTVPAGLGVPMQPPVVTKLVTGNSSAEGMLAKSVGSRIHRSANLVKKFISSASRRTGRGQPSWAGQARMKYLLPPGKKPLKGNASSVSVSTELKEGSQLVQKSGTISSLHSSKAASSKLHGSFQARAQQEARKTPAVEKHALQVQALTAEEMSSQLEQLTRQIIAGEKKFRLNSTAPALKTGVA